MGMKFFPSFFSNFTTKKVFQFLITPLGFEQCIDKANVFRDRLRQSGKLLFISIFEQCSKA